MKSKRSPKPHWNAVLSRDTVLRIRKSPLPAAELAKKLGVLAARIRLLRNNPDWRPDAAVTQPERKAVHTRITPKLAAQVRADHARGLRYIEIARLRGIDRSVVSRICRTEDAAPSGPEALRCRLRKEPHAAT